MPRRNGERHAIAVTDMSLDLVRVSHSFVIPHMPKEPLKIRVGLHSGELDKYQWNPTFSFSSRFLDHVLSHFQRIVK